MPVKEESGRIRKKSNPFSQVSNYALRDNTLSLKAKGLYALIQSYIDIPNFVLYKTTLVKNCVEGKSAFNAAWNELKDAGYLYQTKITTPKGYLYEYELLDIPERKNQDTENQGLGIQGPENQPLGNSTLGKSGCLNKMKEKNNDLNNKSLHSFMDEQPSLSESEKNDSIFLSSISIKESIEKNIPGLYTYNDYVEFAKNQIDFNRIYPLALYASENTRQVATMEWVYLLADLYSSEDVDLKFSNSSYRMGTVKQKLLTITPENMIGIFTNFMSISNISNPKQYMIKALLNHNSSSGFTALAIEDKTRWMG